MKEFFENIAKWFWNSENIADSISHIALLVVIFALIIVFVVFLCLYKKAHKVTQMYAARAQVYETEITNLKAQMEAKDAENLKLEKAIDNQAKKIEEVESIKALNKEFARIFKESLIVSKKTATIAVDTSNILDALSVEELKEYAAKIGAKIKSNMTKAEMIKVIRSTEVMRKNLEK